MIDTEKIQSQLSEETRSQIKISYKLTDKELTEWHFLIFAEYYKMHPKSKWLIGGLFLMVLLHIYSFEGIFVIPMILAVFAVFEYFMLQTMKRSGTQGPYVLILEQGIFRVETLKQREETPVSAYRCVHSGKRLILLEKQLTKQNRSYVCIPSRLFSTETEKEHFLRQFSDSQLQYGLETEKTESEHDTLLKASAKLPRAYEEISNGSREGRNLYFDLTEEDLLEAVRQMRKKEAERQSVNKRNIMIHPLQAIVLFLFPILGTIMVLLNYLLLKPQAGWPYLYLLPVIWLIVFRIRDYFAGPGYLKRCHENGRLRTDLEGKWKVSLEKERITFVYNSTAAQVSWTKYSEILESNRIFCLCREPGYESLVIPRRAFAEKAEEQEFMAYCTSRGMARIWMQPKPFKPMVTGKRILLVLLIFSLCIPMLSWQKQILSGYMENKQIGREYR